MAERKTIRDYILGNEEITMPKRKTLEAKLEALKRQLETFRPCVCEHCDLVGHESLECPTQTLWGDFEVIHNGEKHDPHSSKRDINYIPPCLRRQPPKSREELNINGALTTLKQSSMYDFYQRLQDSISTRVEPKQEEEYKNVTLISGVDLSEELKHEEQVSIENEEALTEESNYKEQDLVVLNMEESKESPIILGQTILTIGDVVIEVHKGKVNLRTI
ncbi:hypothetical protein TSUD_98830 [Trifolium subterraneum]|uniref:Uncharacterized protein n=1 Tax=Trifolium subterraneum TaxID=3900 RepID=A0A2Z6PG37_TRISU|nr:hypothetical protein TSUD_98830 [Trifolium subterraneum]